MAVQRARVRSRAGGERAVFYVTGQQRLYILARTLRELGARDLSNELMRGLTRAVAPMRSAIRASALSTLPSRGGLAGRIARSRITTRRRTGGRTAGVSLVTSSEHSIRQMDRGILKHPVFGNKEVWVTQRVNSDWWSRPIRDHAAGAREEMDRVMEEIARDVAKRIG